MTLSAIHNFSGNANNGANVVCDIGEIWLCQLINCKYKKNFLVEGEKGIGLEYSGGVFALVFALEFVLENCEILCKGHGLGNAWIWGIRQYGGCQDFLRVQYLYLIRFFNPEKLYTPFTCTIKRLSFRWIGVKGLGSKPYTQPFTNPSCAVSEKCSIFGALLSCGNYSGRLLLARDTIWRAQTASFHAYLAPSQTGYFRTPNDLRSYNPSHVQNSSFNISEVFRNVNAIWISRKNVLSLY